MIDGDLLNRLSLCKENDNKSEYYKIRKILKNQINRYQRDRTGKNEFQQFTLNITCPLDELK